MKLTFHFNKDVCGTINIGDKDYRINDYLLDKKHKYWLDLWANKKLYKDKNIKELLVYKNQTLWYLLDWLIFFGYGYSKNVGIANVLTIIDILDENITENVEAKIYDKNDPLFFNILKSICKKKKVKLRIIERKEIKSGSDIIRKNNFLMKTSIISLLSLKWFLGKLRILIKDREKADVIILSNVRFSRKKDVDNVLFGNIITEFKKKKIKYKIISYNLRPIFTSLKIMILHFLFRKNKLLEDYYSLRMIFSNSKKSNYFKKIWFNLNGSKKFRDSFKYKQIDIYPYILPRFELTFNSLIYMVLENLSVTKEIIDKEKPKIILLDHEYNFYGKGLIINSKNKIYPKIIALEHEMTYPVCVHTHIKDSSVLDKNSKVWRPLPNKKCSWGEHSKKILINTCNYPKTIIEITGNPKFDSLINKKFDKNKIIKKYGLDKNKKRILFASVNSPRLYYYILKLAKNMKNVEFILKPHPSEDINKFNEFFSNKSKNIKIKNIRDDIYELLAISDLLITYNSTVAVEAMVKNVPVISLNHFKFSLEDIPYIKQKIIPDVNSYEELKDLVSKLLSNKKLREEFIKKMNKFILNHNYKNDGKATDRVIKIIKNNLK